MATALVPGLDDELTHALGQLEELLLTLVVWEEDPAALDRIVPTPSPFSFIEATLRP